MITLGTTRPIYAIFLTRRNPWKPHNPNKVRFSHLRAAGRFPPNQDLGKPRPRRSPPLVDGNMPPGGPLRPADLLSSFHLPIAGAAKHLGVSTSSIQKACRKNGVKRWPYRKVLGALCFPQPARATGYDAQGQREPDPAPITHAGQSCSKAGGGRSIITEGSAPRKRPPN